MKVMNGIITKMNFFFVFKLFCILMYNKFQYAGFKYKYKYYFYTSNIITLVVFFDLNLMTWK